MFAITWGLYITYSEAMSDFIRISHKKYIFREEKLRKFLLRGLFLTIPAFFFLLKEPFNVWEVFLAYSLTCSVFGLLFNFIINELMDKEPFYTGSQSFTDAIEKNNPRLFFVLKILWLLLSAILLIVI